MENKPLVSVVVPVYKAEEYLKKCVDSIINQTYKNLEIILIDDGSPDNCGAMCDEFATKDSRIRVIHKENGGQSSARNRGLDEMKGDYVAFVDSDDYILPDMYESLLKKATDYSAEIVCCGIAKVKNDELIGYFNKEYPNKKDILLFNTIEALEENFNNRLITYSPCDKLFAANIWKNLRMTEGKIYEDMEIMPKCIENANKVVYDPFPFYIYNLTEQSTIRGVFNEARFTEADVALEKALDYKTRHPELYNKAFASYIAICFHIIHYSSGVVSCRKRRKELILSVRQKHSKEIISVLSFNNRIKYYSLKISPVFFELLMNIFDFIKQ